MDSNSAQGSVSLAQIAIFLLLISSVNPFQLFYYFSKFCFIYVLVIVTQSEAKYFAARMESKAAEVLAVLKNNNLSIDAKVTHLLGLKSDIKQKNVPEGAVLLIFECLRQSIASQHFSLLAAGFSTLAHFLKRLFIQEQHSLVSTQARDIYPILLERLGDHKERVRAQAAQAFTDLWPAANAEVEHYVLEVALVGKNPKAKEMSMIWLSSMTKSHGLLFRSYVPSLVACLEDADSAVRDTAKLTVVELFQNAPPRAKSDLKRQLATHNVRKSIATAILTSIGLGISDTDLSRSRADSQPPRPPSRGDALHQRPISRVEGHPARPPSRGDALHQRPVSFIESQPARPPSRGDALRQRPMSVIGSQPARPPSRGEALHQHLAEELREGEPVFLVYESAKVGPGSSRSEQDRAFGSAPVSAGHSDASTSRPSSQDGDRVEPLVVASSRDIEDLVRDMLPVFEGRESEENWMHREKSVITLRRLTHGNAPHTFSQTYLAAVKTLLDGIFKVVNSLRTTLATNGCLMVQDLARTCGPKADPMVEIIMQNLVKLCAGMKKITAQNGNVTLDVVLENVTYTPRLLHHVSSASMDKNVQLRLYAAGWLKTLMNKQARHKSSIEHGGGLDILEKCIKKGLSDANPGVREVIRSTFWVFFRIWPERANDILSNLDNKSRSLLEKDPSNPNVDHSSLRDSASKRGLASSTSAISSRSALKEAIAAQKRARLAPARSLPPRPGSAQSALSETISSDHHTKPSAVRTVPTGAHSSLSSAPMRPATKPRRPEITRPATADPYASRKAAASDLHSKASSRMDSSPKVSRSKPSTPLSKSASSTRLRQKTEPPHTASTTKSKPKRLDISKSTRSKDHSVTAGHHQRNDSHDSTASQPFDPTHPPITLSSPDHPAFQASIRLESLPHYTPSEPPHHSPAEFVEPVDISRPTPGMTSKQPEPVRIYEDPIVPAVEQGDHYAHNSSIESHGIEMPHETVEGRPEKPSTSPLQVAEQEYHPIEPLPEQERTASASPANIQTTPQPSDLEPQAPAAGPSTMINSANIMDIFGPYGTLPKSRSKNNENSTPNPRKITLSYATRISAKHNVLEELHTNEPAHRDNTPVAHVERSRQPSNALVTVDEPSNRRWKRLESLHRRRSISPRSQDPVQAKEMLAKGIKRIQMKNMDILGYRKLQGLIEFHDAIFTDEEQYDAMLLALLEELESPPDDRKQPLGRPMDLKTQVLLTVRYMFTHNNKYFAAYYPQAVVALLHARQHYDPMNHIVTGLDETTDDIISEAEPIEIIDAVINMITTMEKNDQEYRTSLPDSTMERIGTYAAGNLMASHLDLRRQSIEVCVQLRSMATSDDHFWTILGRPGDGTRNLLTYYNAKLSKQ
ncbi:hypothetical protein ARAM_004038 [Aspergillus rambellii]|uniref:TOG domain-containing protein n=1 Tax=Aspergillus rambellii TaxID=308745 RepID=A0A0F8VBY4_9EURO|nr:hypothetical protein ARAM_004038 [Aspergillus rambellii]